MPACPLSQAKGIVVKICFFVYTIFRRPRQPYRRPPKWCELQCPTRQFNQKLEIFLVQKHKTLPFSCFAWDTYKPGNPHSASVWFFHNSADGVVTLRSIISETRRFDGCIICWVSFLEGKLEAIRAICRELGVYMRPKCIEKVWIVPLHSYYHASFDQEPDIPGAAQVDKVGNCAQAT